MAAVRTLTGNLFIYGKKFSGYSHRFSAYTLHRSTSEPQGKCVYILSSIFPISTGF